MFSAGTATTTGLLSCSQLVLAIAGSTLIRAELDSVVSMIDPLDSSVSGLTTLGSGTGILDLLPLFTVDFPNRSMVLASHRLNHSPMPTSLFLHQAKGISSSLRGLKVYSFFLVVLSIVTSAACP